jgi:hypothetical protein
MRKLFIHKSIQISPKGIQVDGKPLAWKPESTDIHAFLKEIYQHLQLNYSKFYKMDALCKLGFLASEMLLADRQITFQDHETALVFCNASSSLNTDVAFQQTLHEIPSPAVFVYTLPNIVIGEICIRHGFKGEAAFFVQERWNVAFNTQYVATLFETTATRQCLTGWVEVAPNGDFNAQMMLVSAETTSIPFTDNEILNLYQ